MFPDKKPLVSNTPVSLPPVQLDAVAPQLMSAQQSLSPDKNIEPSDNELELMVDKVKLLITQYSANPYTFSAAFQQLKARYLLDHYHIDPNTEKH